MRKDLLNRFLLILALCAGLVPLGFGQVVGDFRSTATGNWDAVTTWQRFDGTNWNAAAAKPADTNSVYIQTGHIVTLTMNEACNDLNLAVAATTGTNAPGILKIQNFVLELSGKLRAYAGAVGTIPGTDDVSSTDFLYGSGKWPLQQTGGGTGVVRVVGNSRALTSSGQWGNGSGTSASYVPNIEIALNAGQTVSLGTNIKFGNWNIKSGTLDASTFSISADVGTSLKDVVVLPGAVFKSATAGNLVQKTSSTAIDTFLVSAGATLELSGATPKIQATTIILNGTVDYNAAGDQTLLVKGSAGADPGTYNTLLLSNSGVKTLGVNTTVNTLLSISGSASLNLGGFSLVDKSANDITAFDLPGQVASVIDAVNHKVTVTMPSGSSVNLLVPTIAVSANATISPLSGVEQNFTSPVDYTVTSENGAPQVWRATVEIEAATASEILAFSINGESKAAVINDIDHTVEVTMPFGTNPASLVAAFTLSTGATASVSGTAQVSETTANNFSSPVVYHVVAQDVAYSTDWTVTVVVEKNSKKEFLSYSFDAVDPKVTGVINASGFTVTAAVPFGTDLTTLVASFSVSPQATVKVGSTVQVSGTTSNNFTSSVVYTITAGDGTTQEWTVSVNIAGEPLTYDGFEYEAGQLLSSQFAYGWANYSSAGKTEVMVSEGNLSYPGLLGSKGNKATFDSDGTDISKSFNSQSAIGSKVYYSFLLNVDSMKNVTSGAGTHFAGFSQATSTVGASVYFKWDSVASSNKFFIGLAVRGATASTPVYTTAKFDAGTTLLIVGCYEFVDGLTNDKSYLWINPVADDLGTSTAPAASLTAEGGAATDLSSVGYFYIRQDLATSTPYMSLDEIRVGLNWADVTPKAGVVSFFPDNNAIDVDVAVHPTITFIKPIRKIGGAAIGNSDIAGLITFKQNNASGANVPYTAVIDGNKQVITITPNSALAFNGKYYLATASVEDNTGASIAAKNSSFTVRAAGTNADLNDLTADGVTLPGFSTSTLSYDVLLDYGITQVPALAYTLADENASAGVTNASALPGTSTVVVTAEDGSTEKSYSVHFSAASTPSHDATLADLKVGGVTIEGFTPSIYEYLVELPFGTVIPSDVSATKSSKVATMEVYQAQSMTDMAFVVVTAQDGSTQLTYTVIFGINDYIYKVGFSKVGAGNNEVPFPGWTTDNTIVSSNWGTNPIVNHAEFEGPEAFRFITGKNSTPPTPPSTPGWLKTSKYPKSGILRFWLYVQASDGTEQFLIHKKVQNADSVLVGSLSSLDMTSTNWKEFSFEINESDSTAIIFTSVLTTDATTRIWMDDLSLKGKLGTGIRNYSDGSPVSLFPNPAQEFLNINLDGTRYQQFEVFSSMGTMIMSREITGSNFSVPVGNLQPGVYLVRFLGDGVQFTGRFLKQ